MEQNNTAVKAPPLTPAGPQDTKQSSKAEPRGTIAEWTVTILLLLFGTTTLVQAFVIPTGSMEDNLLIGDHLLVDKLAYAPHGPISAALLPYSEPQRGDIIVFRYPEDIRSTYVKRVIGVPGDRIHVVSRQVFLNGKPLDEPYKFHKRPEGNAFGDTWPQPERQFEMYPKGQDMLAKHYKDGDIIVPPNNFFAMGDNRDNSADSRYWGFVPRENIIGKPLIIYWSYDAKTEDLASGNIGLDHLLDIVFNFFSKTRWNREFMLIHGYKHKNLN